MQNTEHTGQFMMDAAATVCDVAATTNPNSPLQPLDPTRLQQQMQQNTQPAGYMPQQQQQQYAQQQPAVYQQQQQTQRSPYGQYTVQPSTPTSAHIQHSMPPPQSPMSSPQSAVPSPYSQPASMQRQTSPYAVGYPQSTPPQQQWQAYPQGVIPAGPPPRMPPTRYVGQPRQQATPPQQPAAYAQPYRPSYGMTPTMYAQGYMQQQPGAGALPGYPGYAPPQQQQQQQMQQQHAGYMQQQPMSPRYNAPRPPMQPSRPPYHPPSSYPAQSMPIQSPPLNYPPQQMQLAAMKQHSAEHAMHYQQQQQHHLQQQQQQQQNAAASRVCAYPPQPQHEHAQAQQQLLQQQQQRPPVHYPSTPQQQKTQYYAHHPSNDWRTTIILNGGTVDTAYSQRVTHVLVESMRHPVVSQAIKDRKRCVTACWLNDCIGQRRMTPPTKVVHFPTFYSPPNLPMHNKLFTVSGFDEVEQTYLRLMIASVGGRYTTYVSAAHDFVVAKSPTGQKVLRAAEWRVPIVNVQWMIELCAGHDVTPFVDSETYRRFVNQPHTDVLNIHPSAFENYDSIYTHLLAGWREPIGVTAEVWKAAKTMRERMDNHDMDTQQDYSSVKSKLLKLSPAPGEEEILVKTQQMPTIEGEIGRVPRVAFSGFVVDEMDNLNRKARWLGAEITSNVIECTHLVCKNLSRTRKLLEAVALGKYVVGVCWIEDSFEKKEFIDTLDCLVKDDENEIAYSYNLAKSLVAARKSRLFEDLLVYITPCVRPSVSFIGDLVRIAGGRVLPKLPNYDHIAAFYARNIAFVVIACVDDLAMCSALIECGIALHTSEFVLTGLLQHKIDYDTFRLQPTPTTGVPPHTNGHHMITSN